MLTQSIIAVAIVALTGVLVSSNQYGPTYNDGYEPQPQYHQPQSYQPPASYQAAPSYQPAPAYPKYSAPSSAHHTQYDNYYPKQTYSKPMYSAPMYQQPAYPAPKPTYSASRPSYPAPSYGGHQDAEEYKA